MSLDQARKEIFESGLLEELAYTLADDTEEKVEFFEALFSNEVAAKTLVTAKFVDASILFMVEHAQDDDRKKWVMKHGLILASLASIDENLNVFMRDSVIQYLLQLCKNVSLSEDVKTNAVLVLGNMARTEANCIQLGKLSVIERMMELLATAESISLKCAVLGCLKNLSIPVVNKMIMTLRQMMVALVPHIQSHIPEIQMGALVILKNLTRGIEDNCRAMSELIVSSSNQTLLQLVINTSAQSNEEAVYSEGTRVVINVLRASVDIRPSLVKEGSLPLFVRLLNSKHIVLKAEALLALTVLSSASLLESLYQDEPEAHKLVQALTAMLKDPETPVDVVSNACVLVRDLLRQTDATLKRIIDEYRSAWIEAVHVVNERAHDHVSGKEKTEPAYAKVWISLSETSRSALDLLKQ